MTGYGGRLRSLEGRFGSGACPLCGGGNAVDFHTVHAGESVPPPALCRVCGAPRRQFIVEMPVDAEPMPVRPEPEQNTAAVVNSKPRTRRRQWYG
jgi:rubredoxin